MLSFKQPKLCFNQSIEPSTKLAHYFKSKCQVLTPILGCWYFNFEPHSCFPSKFSAAMAFPNPGASSQSRKEFLCKLTKIMVRTNHFITGNPGLMEPSALVTIQAINRSLKCQDQGFLMLCCIRIHFWSLEYAKNKQHINFTKNYTSHPGATLGCRSPQLADAGEGRRWSHWKFCHGESAAPWLW